MRKIILILISFILFCGCSKQDTVTLTLVTQNVKTNLNGKNVVWCDGDRINVNGTDYTISVNGDTARVRVDISPDNKYYAYYPADGVNSFNDGVFNVTLPTQYICRSNSMIIPLTGYSDGGALVMTNIMSMLVLHIDCDDDAIINDIMIATGGVSGIGTIDNINNTPIFSMIQSSRTPLVLLNPNRIEQDIFYVPILPLNVNSILYIQLNYTKMEQFGDFSSESYFNKKFNFTIDDNVIVGGMKPNYMYHLTLTL